MASRVYWKRLEIVATHLQRYIQKHQLQLQRNLTDEQYACVVALLNAVIECLAALPQNPET